ncbi:MAG: hypothetical protein LH618_07785, partial [Saprospiraceae bacterium]|nr:hypothetical protein [Saprospiraceae bacterium]
MDIICHAFPAWEGNYLKSTVELMKCLAARHRVLYVDYAYKWTDFFKSLWGKSTASWQRMLGWAPRLRRVTLENGAAIQVLTLPPVLPSNFLHSPRLHDAINRFNGLFIRYSVRRAQSQLAIQQPVVVNAFNPGFGLLLAGRLRESRLVYYCYDEIGAATWAGRHGARLEREFLQKCDGVAVSSSGLLRSKSALHDRVSLVKNGVDFELFQREIPVDDLPIVPDLLVGQPVVGYLGSVDDRLDFELLERLFVTFPQYRFLFVGRVQSDAIRQRLTRHPN